MTHNLRKFIIPYRSFIFCLCLLAGFSLEGRNFQTIVPHWLSITYNFPKDFQVQALTVNAEQKLLYIAGTCNDSFCCVKRWNDSVWEDIGIPLNGAVTAMALYDSTLYIGGEFTGTLEQPKSLQHIARYDAATKAWLPVGAGLDNTVLALCSDSRNLYIGGTFEKTYDGLKKLNSITVWDGIQFHQTGDSRSPGLTAFGGRCSVQALLPVGDVLYLGGTFTEDNTGKVLNRVAKLDIESNKFSPLGRGFNNGCVNTIVFNGSKIIAGGSFNQINPATGSDEFLHAGYIAEWDGENWMNLGDFNNPIQSIVTNESVLYAAGMFTKNGSTPINHIARYDYRRRVKEWLPLSLEDSGLTRKEGPVRINALGKWKNALFVCGNFDASQKVPDLNGVAVWSDTICASCLYCDFTPNYFMIRYPHKTQSCQALIIVPSVPAPFGITLKYFTQIKPDEDNSLSWEMIPRVEVLNDTLWSGYLNQGQNYYVRAYAECTFPVAAPKSFSPSLQGHYGTRTVRAGKIRETSAEISLGLEATVDPVSITVYYRKLGEESWKSQTSMKPVHPTVFKIKGLHPKTVYEFKEGFVFKRFFPDDTYTTYELVEDCIYTFKTK